MCFAVFQESAWATRLAWWSGSLAFMAKRWPGLETQPWEGATVWAPRVPEGSCATWSPCRFLGDGLGSSLICTVDWWGSRSHACVALSALGRWCLSLAVLEVIISAVHHCICVHMWCRIKGANAFLYLGWECGKRLKLRAQMQTWGPAAWFADNL